MYRDAAHWAHLQSRFVVLRGEEEKGDEPDGTDEIVQRLLEAVHFSLAGHDDVVDLVNATERKINILAEGIGSAIGKIGEVVTQATNEDAFLSHFNNLVNAHDFQEYIAGISNSKDHILSRKRGADDDDADDVPLEAAKVPRRNIRRRA